MWVAGSSLQAVLSSSLSLPFLSLPSSVPLCLSSPFLSIVYPLSIPPFPFLPIHYSLSLPLYLSIPFLIAPSTTHSLFFFFCCGKGGCVNNHRRFMGLNAYSKQSSEVYGHSHLFKFRREYLPLRYCAISLCFH